MPVGGIVCNLWMMWGPYATFIPKSPCVFPTVLSPHVSDGMACRIKVLLIDISQYLVKWTTRGWFSLCISSCWADRWKPCCFFDGDGPLHPCVTFRAFKGDFSPKVGTHWRLGSSVVVLKHLWWGKDTRELQRLSFCLNAMRGLSQNILITVELLTRMYHLEQGIHRMWGFKIQDYYIISSEKLKCGWTLTASQYTITHIVYFKTQRTVIENTKVT